MGTPDGNTSGEEEGGHKHLSEKSYKETSLKSTDFSLDGEVGGGGGAV